MDRLHARYWHYDGNHHAGHDCERYDPHGFGLDLIATMANVASDWEDSFGNPDHEIGQLIKQHGGNLDGVVVRYHRGDGFGRQVHVAATEVQWAALKAADALLAEAYASQFEQYID
jgi:hypothetical protein